jgi:ATP-dependent RNA/DNA helicase IGHMBP2
LESPKEQLRKTLGLLQMERQADLEQYRQKVLMRPLHARVKEGMTWYPVKLVKEYIGTGERIIIEVERTNQKDQPHAFQSGKMVSVFSNASGKSEKQHQNGVINYVRDNLMVITLNGDDLPEWIDSGLLGVDVMFDEMSYREMEFTLKKVIEAEDNRVAEFRELLLGEAIAGYKLQVTGSEKLETSNQQLATVLNESQLKAARKIIESRDIAFIHGPPGTGKTTTIVQVIKFTVKEEGQVLVCAPSNAAVDLLVDKLSEQGLNVIRIGHPARVTEQSLSKTLDARIAQHQNYDELRSLRKKMEHTRQMADKYKRNFGHFEKAERRVLRDQAKQLKADADMLEFYITNDILQKSEVICCTLVGSSHPTLRSRKYKTAFIDEAGQALEPACWIPFLRAQRVVLAGDHLQLPPTVKSNEAAKLGLAETLFEKGIKKLPAQSSMLQVQYRMHEDIMKFSSNYFYKDELVAHESVRAELLRPNQPPIEFIDSAGAGYTEEQDPETLSRLNKEEASLLIRLAEKLIEEIGLEDWLTQNITMGIITPYRAQVDYLHHLAESSPLLEPLHKLVTINTVDAFQGQERDVIAISFVRSNAKGEVGFLADIRRTNVAITRAKKKLIMIGDSATLGTHPFYVKLLEYVQGKEFYRSVFEIQ